MSKIPCRKCKKCGKYSDLSSLLCICGEDISGVFGTLVETSELSDDLIGEIDAEFEVYVQKCSACGTLNFTVSEDAPVKMCCNCHKARIATVKPAKYERKESAAEDSDDDSEVKNPVAIPEFAQPKPEAMSLNISSVNEEDDDEEDDDALQWMSILGGIKSAAETVPVSKQSRDTIPEEDDEENDEVDNGSWGSVFGGTSLTIVAVRYGELSYTIKKTDVPLLLGRNAALSEFLSKDMRVSNSHCYIEFENGDWIVRDNNSSNGTAVNSKDIGYGGKMIIKNGDLLKLGHHQDSMEFKVMIG